MSDFFCPLPWIHQFVQASGTRCCCSNSTILPVRGQEFTNSDFIKDLRQQILSGQVPDSCRSCLRQESSGFVSTRQSALRDWPYTADSVPDQLLYVDFRQSNLCNFRCRTCHPAYSNQIDRELKNNPELKKFYGPAEASLEVDVDLSAVRVVSFTGGEPLLIKQHIETMESLIAQGRTDVKVLITTNVSALNPKLLDLLGQFQDIHFTLSVDAVGTPAEYIRDGTDWSVVDRNIHSFCSLGKSVSVNCTVSNYSVLTIDSLVNYVIQLKNHYPNTPIELLFSVVHNPVHLVPQALPAHLRHRAISSLEKAIECLGTFDSNPPEQIDTLKNLLNKINETRSHGLISRFVEFTETLDRTRNQTFSETFGVPLYDL